MASAFTRTFKRILIGETLDNSEFVHQRLNKIRALAVFSSDALSSVAYSTEEVLANLQAIAAAYVLDISVALIVLLGVLTMSYRQTIHAYPTGGGSYIVAKDNLGILPGLIAAAALLVDYVLTVSVSMASGIANIASAYPKLQPFQVELCILAIAFITVVNLRGVKESGTAFSIPTYVFLASSALLLTVGLFKYFTGSLPPVAPHSAYIPAEVPVTNSITAFLFLRAFAAGCTALTGVEAISNGVPAFQKPEAANAAKTMTWMAVCLGVMVIGNAFLAKVLHILPMEKVTVMSQTAAAIYGQGSVLHMVHQFATMGILVLAANTSFADFPRLASLLSKDRFLPRAMATKGDRLVFQNGIVALSLVSMVLIVAFQGDTHKLLPLYAVGVFISFTLSQSGMVVRWVRRRDFGHAAINGLGAIVTGVVSMVIMYTKFVHGAWIVVLIIPIIVAGLLRIHRHYEHIRLTLKVGQHQPISRTSQKHLVVVAIGNTTNVARKAMEDLISLVSRSVIIKPVHINIHDESDPRRKERADEFAAWVSDLNEERKAEGYEPIELTIVDSPKRSVLEPLEAYIVTLQQHYPDHHIRIFVPEFIANDWFARLALHGHMGRAIFDHFRARGYQVSSIPKRV